MNKQIKALQNIIEVIEGAKQVRPLSIIETCILKGAKDGLRKAEKQPPVKILIQVEGGNLSAIFSNQKDVKIVIVDHDKPDHGEKATSEILEPDYFVMEEERGEKFYERFDDPGTRIEEIREDLKRMKF